MSSIFLSFNYKLASHRPNPNLGHWHGERIEVLCPSFRFGQESGRRRSRRAAQGNSCKAKSWSFVRLCSNFQCSRLYVDFMWFHEYMFVNMPYREYCKLKVLMTIFVHILKRLIWSVLVCLSVTRLVGLSWLLKRAWKLHFQRARIYKSI